MKHSDPKQTTSITKLKPINTAEVNDILSHCLNTMGAIRPILLNMLKDPQQRKSYGGQLLTAFRENDFNMDDIKRGLVCLRKQESPYAPAIGEFIAMCKIDPGTLGIPSEQVAYHEACHGRYPHSCVRVAARRIGIFELKTRPARETQRLFFDHYEDVVKEFMRGDLEELLEIEPPKTDTRKESTPEQEKKAIAEIWKIFEND